LKVRITITGTAPLLMHNVRLANPLDPIARAMKETSGKRKKTDEDLERLARLEFEGGLYVDSAGPYLPGANIEKCLVEGARVTRQGKQVERGLFVTDNEVPLLYDGPRTADGLWADESFRSMMAVKVGTSRVMRCRPMERTIARQEDMIRRLDVKQQRTDKAIAESREQQVVTDERLKAVEDALKRHGIEPGDADGR
jgi:hypothetical protein